MDGEIKHVAIKDLTGVASISDTDLFIVSNSERTYNVTAKSMAEYFGNGSGGSGGGNTNEIISTIEPNNQNQNDYWIYPY